jgi:hypothetical protein
MTGEHSAPEPLPENPAAAAPSGRFGLDRDRAVLTAGAVATAVLAIIAPLFTLFSLADTAPGGGSGFAEDIGGWGRTRQHLTRAGRTLLTVPAGSGHGVQYGIVLVIGAVVLLAGAVGVVALVDSVAGALAVTSGAALLVGAMILALLDGLSQVSYNAPGYHWSLGVSFWLFMTVGLLAAITVALGVRNLLRRIAAPQSH